jgi:S1-C subfamily serine protease
MPQCHMCLAVILLMLSSAIARADKLMITNTPSGATVEIDGVKVRRTPFVKDYPGGYFHRTKTAVGKRLEHPLAARIILEGFAPKEFSLCDGPTQWRDTRGRDRGEYWTFKLPSFEVTLVPISKEFTGEVAVKTARNLSVELVRDLKLEEIVALVKPSVVYLEGSKRAGTGFLVTGTGLIATNAHVARGEESLLAKLSGGVQLVASVAYIDDDVDIALLKVEGANFPHLVLADASTIRQGQEVFAVGNPGEAMAFSVTKGIVSAVDKFPIAGPGTWIQTDAQLNPGNSGGPLINMKGEVIGITTSKPSGATTTGIGFALSASDLIRILRDFYPKENVLPEKLAAPSPPDSKAPAPLSREDSLETPTVGRDGPEESSRPSPVAYGTVEVRGASGSKIEVDDIYVGDAPASLSVTTGKHKVVVIPLIGPRQPHIIYVLAGSHVSLEPPLGLQQSPK